MNDEIVGVHQNHLSSPGFTTEFVVQLARKIEHAQLDINSLRDNLLASSSTDRTDGDRSSSSYYAQISQTSWTQANQRISQLYSDLEALRLLVRRTEVHQSVELNVFSQIREIQRFVRGLQRLLDERAPANAIISLSSKVDNDVRDLNCALVHYADNARSDLESARRAIMIAIPEIARQQGQISYEENAGLTNYVNRPDYDAALVHIDSQLQSFSDKVSNLTLLYNKRGMKEANEYVKSFIVEKILSRQKRLFALWVSFTEFQREIERLDRVVKGKEFVWKMFHAFKFYALKCAVLYWKSKVDHMVKVSQYQVRLEGILKYWKERVDKDLLKYMRKWRCNAVVLRPLPTQITGNGSSGTAGTGAVMDGDVPLVDVVKHSIKKLKDLGNSPVEAQVKFSVLSGAFLSVAGSLGGWESSIIQLRKDSKNQAKNTQMSEQNLKTLFESQVGSVAGNLSKVSVTLAQQLNSTNQNLEGLSNRCSDQFAKVGDRSLSAEQRLDRLEEGLRDHDTRFQRILLLQGDMLERIDKLEIFQKHSIAKFEKAIKESAEAKRRGENADKSNARLKESLGDSMIFFDSEVKSLKTFALEMTSELQKIGGKQESTEVILATSTNNLLSRAEALEAQARDFFPLPPHPSDLVELCLQYEAHCVESHCLGQAGMNFTPDLTLKFADFCRKFVHHIDEELEVGKFAEIVRGSCGSQGLLGDSINIRTQRQALIDSFVDSFATLLRETESTAPPGAVRANARVFFYRRFMRTIGGFNNSKIVSSKGVEGSPDRFASSRSPKRQNPPESSHIHDSFKTPTFHAPPWRGGDDFVMASGLIGDDEEKEAAIPTFPNTRGVLATGGASTLRSDKETIVSDVVADTISDRKRTIRRPNTTGRLPSVAAGSGFKFVGSGFKMPKEQASTQVVNELIGSFQRSCSIPLIGSSFESGDVPMQSRRLDKSSAADP